MHYIHILGILGIAVVIAILTVQAGWVGAFCGIALVGLTSLVNHPSKPPELSPKDIDGIQRRVAAILDQVQGITAAHPRDFEKALPIMMLKDGTTVRTWKNLVGVDHVFLADKNSQMIYGAYVGWIHNQGLQQAIAKIRREFS
ncbi:MAG TPA: hypothetical protein V6D29_17750 [Leptolyngbyaceae cyanobacterium]